MKFRRPFQVVSNVTSEDMIGENAEESCEEQFDRKRGNATRELVDSLTTNFYWVFVTTRKLVQKFEFRTGAGQSKYTRV